MRRFFRGFLPLILLSISGCERTPKPASIEVAKTLQLGNREVRLSAEAQNAIGLQTAKVAEHEIADVLAATGWLMPVPGSEVVIKAASAGFVSSPTTTEAEPFPTLGAAVSAGKTLALLQVFVSPQEQAQLIAAKEDADATIAQAEVTSRLIGEQLQRARTAEEAISRTRLVELQETYDKAQAAMREARDKLPFLPSEPYRAQLELKPVPITSPLAGRVVAVHVAPKQFVASGDPLWTIADWSHYWLRVPVFEVDLAKIEVASPAEATVAGDRKTTFTATPVKAPQSVDAGRRTIDVYYRLDNTAGSLRPGQALAVSLPTSAAMKRNVIPFDAVLWDEQGGTWVYVRNGDDKFQRRRVEFGRRLGDDVVIERGLSDEDEVVTVGAQSLYGEEFKSAIPVDDDD